VCIPTLNEEGVGVVSRRQDYPANRYSVCGKTMSQLLCSLLATVIGIIVEADIDDAWLVT
jgi:hypothetical protein